VSTVAQVLTRLRLLLQETSAVEWTDAQLIQYINDSHLWLGAHMGNVYGAGWFEHSETFTVAASTETYDTSGLTRTFAAVKQMYHQRSDSYEVQVDAAIPGKFNMLRLANETVNADYTPKVILRRAAGTTNLHFLPLAGGIRTFRLTYRYEPDVLTSGQALHTPAAYDDILAKRAMFLALQDEGEDDPLVDAFLQRRLQEMAYFEGGARGENVASRMGDETTDILFGG